MCGPQCAGSWLLVGLAVAGGQRFSHGCGGVVRGVVGPTQGELQGGTLREALKRRQTLRTEADHKRFFLRPEDALLLCETQRGRSLTHLSIQDGLPRCPLLVDGTLLGLLHGHLVLSVQQLQPSAQQARVIILHQWHQQLCTSERHLFLSKTVI